jgi:triacylglycerol lipase
MKRLEKRLLENAYEVTNINYPSRSKTIEEIAGGMLPKAIESCSEKGAKKIHFVTHSMGGIVVRYYLKNNKMQDLGRVVMISPPNGGSTVVDELRDNIFFKWLNGPAGRQLGTDNDSIPRKLGSVDFELGIITGDRSVNPLLSFVIPGDNDGKVSVASAKVEGMKDFIVIHATHPFIMKNDQAIEKTLTFLKYGSFKRTPSNKAGK